MLRFLHCLLVADANLCNYLDGEKDRQTDRLVEVAQAIDSLQCTRVLRFMGNVMERPNQMRCIPGQSNVVGQYIVSIVESQLNLHKRKTCEWSRYLGSSSLYFPIWAHSSLGVRHQQQPQTSTA